VRQRRLVYQLKNSARQDKTALLRLPLVNNAKITGAKVYYEADQQAAYAVLPSPAGKTATLPIATFEGVRRVIGVSDISIYRLNEYASDQSLPQATRRVLASAAKALDQAYEVKFRTARVRAGLAALHADSTRLQQLIKTIRGNTGTASDEWMQRLLTFESRIRITATELNRLERLDPFAPVRAELAKLPAPAAS